MEKRIFGKLMELTVVLHAWPLTSVEPMWAIQGHCKGKAGGAGREEEEAKSKRRRKQGREGRGASKKWGVEIINV